MAAQTGLDQSNLSIDSSLSAEAGSLLGALSRARDASELDRLRLATQQTGHVALHWNVATDSIAWTENAAAVLGLDTDALPRKSEALRAMMPAEDRDRYEALVLDNTQVDDGDGIEYDVCYTILHGKSREPVRIEERGRVVCGTDGTTRDVIAILRRDHHTRDDVSAPGLLDEETGLPSGPALMAHLAKQVTGQDSGSCGLIIATMSNINDIRETYGPAIVPETILATATRLRSVMRGADLLGRCGPAQFAIVLRDCSSEQIQIAGDRFVAAIRNDVIATKTGPVWVELTAGGVIVPAGVKEPGTAYDLAQEALSQAECSLESPFVVYQPSPQRLSQHSANRQHANEIIEGLNEERFTLWHQPIVAAKDARPVMYESLLRMKSADGSILPAAHLVPIADKLGFMQMIDAMVCRTSLALLAGKPDATVSFNLSDSTLRNTYAATRILSIVAEAGACASQICVEVSHMAARQQIGAGHRTLKQLRDLGCSIAVSGYLHEGLSLSVLKLADYVKLDGAVCAGISGRPDDLPLIRAAVEFAHRAGAKVIAEHVETEADASILSEIGVDYMQGYLFGKASPDHFHVTLSTRDNENPVEHETGQAVPDAVAEGSGSQAVDEQIAGSAQLNAEGDQPGTAESPAVEQAELAAELAGGAFEDASHAFNDAEEDLLKSALSKLDSI